VSKLTGKNSETKNEETVIKNNVACRFVIACFRIYIISTELRLREFIQWWYTWSLSTIWCTWYTSHRTPFNIRSRSTAAEREKKKCKIKIFYVLSVSSLEFHNGIATETSKWYIRWFASDDENSTRHKRSHVRCIFQYYF